MHGAGSGPWIFEPWRCSFEGWAFGTFDPEGGLRALSGGRPGAAESAVARAERKRGWGLVLDRRIPEALAAAIARLWD